MDLPHVRFRLPDGTQVAAAAHAVVGRSPIAAVRLDDPRVSTIHAEVSWRDDGLVLLARGGRLVVHGRAVRELLLEAGQQVVLVPGVVLDVVDVVEGAAAPIPPTAGRAALRWRVSEARVTVHRGDEAEPTVDATGTLARVLGEIVRAGEAGCPWDRAAERVWPEDGRIRERTRVSPGSTDDWTEADERRLRNRWDQQLMQVRKVLEPLRTGIVEVRGGVVIVHVGLDDRVESAPVGP